MTARFRRRRRADAKCGAHGMGARSRRVTSTLALVAAFLVAAKPAIAQTANQRERCPVIELVYSGAGLRLQPPGGQAVSIGWNGVIFVCRAAGIRLTADSAEMHEGSQIAYLFGKVRYTEQGTVVTARRMTYWKNEERLLAEGEVVALLDNGTTMRGPRVEYFRPVPGLRQGERLHATGRPRISLVETDTSSAGRAGGTQAPPAADSARRSDTTHVDANVIVMDGDSLVNAAGQVVVTRPDVIATSDSLALDRARETARFLRSPVIKGLGERPFTLTGSVIDLYSRERRLERVVSAVTAKVVSEDLEITSDTLDLRLADQRLQRAFAWGASRAHAVTPTQDLRADSLDMIMPGQRLEQVHAVGGAEARTTPDSTKIIATDRDLLRGDTILALFDSIPPADTSTQARLRELRARVRAVAFYHLAPSDTLSRCPNINYSNGGEIVVRFEQGEVRDVIVARDSLPAMGGYFECGPTGAGAARTPPRAAPATPPSPPPGSPPPIARREPHHSALVRAS